MSSDRDSLHPFFADALSPFPRTPRRAPRSQDRAIRSVHPEPDPVFWRNFFSRSPRSERDVRSVTRNRLPAHRRIQPSILKGSRRSRNLFQPQLSLEPPSPETPSEEDTPTPSPRSSPPPPRSPSPKLKEYNPIARPNTPTNGLPKNYEQRAEDNINMGFGFAESWVDTLKPRRRDAEERIRLPTIYRRRHRKTLIMLVAHKNVEATIFDKVEVPMKSEKKMKEALSAHFNVPEPFHRIRYSISDVAEVPLTQSMVDRFEAVEYFRLDTTKPNKWILYHIVNCGP